MKTYSVNAYAKLNLHLDITGRREDGYHNIETLFQSIDLHDTLNITEAGSFSMNISEKSIPVNAANTVYKAYQLFKGNYRGKWTDFNVNIEKNIPTGSGMGGGSADGAAMLNFLNSYYDSPFNESQLGEMALSVGADVVFLMHGGTAIGRGLGEDLDFMAYRNVEKLYAFIVYPNVHISTKWAYENVKKYLTTRDLSYNINNSKKSYKQFIGSLKKSYNIFEPLVFEFYPRLKGIKEKLNNMEPVISLMTGSGSAFFAVFDREIDLRSAEKEFGGNSIYWTRLLQSSTVKHNFNNSPRRNNGDYGSQDHTKR